MSDKNSDLEYVSNVLRKADANRACEPMIYGLWGCIVLVGYGVIEYAVDYATAYWIVASIVGGLLSWWLGARASKNIGQSDKALGLKHLKNNLVMLVFIFTAVFTQQYLAILLLIGMAYCLIGLYLDKVMLLAGAAAWLAYVGLYIGLISSALIVGIVIALAFFVSAWAAARANKLSQHAA